MKAKDQEDTRMSVELKVDDKGIALNAFTQEFMGNVAIAMAESLRGVNVDWKDITIKIVRD
ncbi:MAG: hypothetical protein EHM14_12155 [Methanothrix sp.]|nr:MAG: hypothetical protein EHM14_12155 [Methanothrix sp.]